MGKKHKDGKDGKKGKKKKSHEDVSGAGLSAAVVNAARTVRVPARAAAAVDPPTGATVGVGGRAVSSVTERHQPIDVTPVEGTVRLARQIERGRADAA